MWMEPGAHFSALWLLWYCNCMNFWGNHQSFFLTVLINKNNHKQIYFYETCTRFFLEICCGLFAYEQKKARVFVVVFVLARAIKRKSDSVSFKFIFNFRFVFGSGSVIVERRKVLLEWFVLILDIYCFTLTGFSSLLLKKVFFREINTLCNCVTNWKEQREQIGFWLTTCNWTTIHAQYFALYWSFNYV